MNFRNLGTVKNRYWGLLASQAAMLLVAPVLEPEFGIRLVAEFLFGSLLVFAVWIASHDRRSTIVASVLAVGVFAGGLVGNLADIAQPLAIATTLIGCAFFAYVTAIIFRDTFFSTYVSLNTIIGAICVYMQIGLFFGFAFTVVDLVDPSAFADIAHSESLVSRFIYFSFVTLTTLGYGDIAPLSPSARSLAVLEAIIGQVYLTVLVARLVGLHLSQGEPSKELS